MIEASQMQNLAHMQAEEDWVPVLDQAAAVVLENSIKIGLRGVKYDLFSP